MRGDVLPHPTPTTQPTKPEQAFPVISTSRCEPCQPHSTPAGTPASSPRHGSPTPPHVLVSHPIPPLPVQGFLCFGANQMRTQPHLTQPCLEQACLCLPMFTLSATLRSCYCGLLPSRRTPYPTQYAPPSHVSPYSCRVSSALSPSNHSTHHTPPAPPFPAGATALCQRAPLRVRRLRRLSKAAGGTAQAGGVLPHTRERCGVRRAAWQSIGCHPGERPSVFVFFPSCPRFPLLAMAAARPERQLTCTTCPAAGQCRQQLRPLCHWCRQLAHVHPRPAS